MRWWIKREEGKADGLGWSVGAQANTEHSKSGEPIHYSSDKQATIDIEITHYALNAL